MKYWNNPKQSASSKAAAAAVTTAIPSIVRNAKLNDQQSIVVYNPNNCEETTTSATTATTTTMANESSNELDIVKTNEVNPPHRDYKQANSSSNTNNVTIVNPLAPKDFGCDDTYEDGIDNINMRDLERRLESELEEHDELWSPDDETPISQA